jgi:hypothetical protein
LSPISWNRRVISESHIIREYRSNNFGVNRNWRLLSYYEPMDTTPHWWVRLTQVFPGPPYQHWNVVVRS